MLDRRGARYGLKNDSLFLLAGGDDPAYSARIYLHGSRTLGFHVCFLGPYYGVHRLGGPGEEPAASEIVQEIEATYPGYEPIPEEIGNEVVPDVAPDVLLLGEGTIYDCLLSVTWATSSVP